MFSHHSQNCIECAYSKRFVRGNGHSLACRRFRLKDYVASSLTYFTVAPASAKAIR